MSTRTIVTSQPDVACDVCERRLLRGEQPEIFLAAGRPRTVCELCAPRATHEGWLRESDERSVSQPPLRTRRGRNLFGRLLQATRPEDSSPEPAGTGALYAGEPEPYDFLGGDGGAAAPVGPAPLDGGSQARAEGDPFVPRPDDELLERAIEAFNAGEGPRRVASLARSLGAPCVSIRADDDLGVVAIVVAWELCWYRYQVDVQEQAFDVSVIAQGTELEELARPDRVANAVADELGALSLTGAHA
ncbi:MAG: hypothetical protein ACHP93_01590 [Solirubrobacterales bacterium]